MEHPFEYLKYKYGLAGAREKFESICVELIQTIYEDDSHSVDSAGGDGGIDIFVGDYNGDLDVYQCKYFIGKIDSIQKKQIIDSLNKVVSEKGDNITAWYLCVAKDFNKKEHKWWANWKQEMSKTYKFKIKLWEASKLTTKLKNNGLFNRYFLNENTKKEEFSNDFRNTISTMVENRVYYDLEFLCQLETLIYKWQADEYLINRKTQIFSYMNEFISILAFNNGKLMNNEESRERVTSLLKLIVTEYVKLVKD
jgi:hypothetical protein